MQLAWAAGISGRLKALTLPYCAFAAHSCGPFMKALSPSGGPAHHGPVHMHAITGRLV